MFCSIEDAWGENKFNDKPIFNINDKPESFRQNEYKFSNDVDISSKNISKNISSIEHFENDNDTKDNKKMYNQYIKLKEMFENDNKNEVCYAVEKHIANCPHCNQKYNSLQMPQMPNIDLVKLMNANKESINIFLIGLLFILILQLFRS